MFQDIKRLLHTENDKKLPVTDPAIAALINRSHSLSDSVNAAMKSNADIRLDLTKRGLMNDTLSSLFRALYNVEYQKADDASVRKLENACTALETAAENLLGMRAPSAASEHSSETKLTTSSEKNLNDMKISSASAENDAKPESLHSGTSTHPAIDVHSHVVLPSFLQAMQEAGIDYVNEEGFPVPAWNVQGHLDYMKENGIGRSIISISTPHIYFKDDAQAEALSSILNAQMEFLCETYPEQFSYAAVLPLPDVDGSIRIAEMAYAHGACAVKFPSNACGIYPGDKRFEPLMEVLEEKQAVVILHPAAPAQIPDGIFTSRPLPLFEYLTDTTRAVLNLIATGTLSRYPHVRFIVPHCGSFLPEVIGRMEGIGRILIPQELMEDVDVQDEFGRLYFDTAGDAVPVMMDALLKVADHSHILFGGDFPYTPSAAVHEKKTQLEAYLQEESLRNDILYRNAEKLFDL